MISEISCGDPPVVKNAQRIYRGNKFEDKVLYPCHQGYEIIGDKELTCSADGSWSGVTPRCQSKLKYFKIININSLLQAYSHRNVMRNLNYKSMSEV